MSSPPSPGISLARLGLCGLLALLGSLSACSNDLGLDDLSPKVEAGNNDQPDAGNNAPNNDPNNTPNNTPNNDPNNDNTDCGANAALCGGVCVNTNSVNSCGGCSPCVPGPNAMTMSCNEGVCLFTCQGNFVDQNEDLTQGSLGDGCECFRSGNELCNGQDDDCDGEVDEGVLNACGGCAELDGDPQDACGEAECPGELECDGTERVVCQGDNVNPCGGCEPLDAALGQSCGQCGEVVCDGPDATRCQENLRTFFFDGDEDTFGIDGDTMELCDPEGQYTATRGGDCDDDRANVNPMAAEVCGNDRDDNCSGGLDDEPTNACGGCATLDEAPGDACGEGECVGELACDGLDRLACQGVNVNACGGCTQLNGNPGDACGQCGTRVCAQNNERLDCQDPGLRTFFKDGDEDTFGVDGDTMELCAPEGQYTATRGGDCDDIRANVRPNAAEVCGNNRDDNCSGGIDDEVRNICGGCQVINGNLGDACGQCGARVCAPNNERLDCQDPGFQTFFRDGDGDTFGLDNDTRQLCAPIGLYTATRGGDCADGDAQRNPGLPEICDNRDNDCDNAVDADDDDLEMPLCELQQGVCQGTRQLCTNGVPVQCSNETYRLHAADQGRIFEAGVETLCGENTDNNCNGTPDENCCTINDPILVPPLRTDHHQRRPAIAVHGLNGAMTVAWLEIPFLDEFGADADLTGFLSMARLGRDGAVEQTLDTLFAARRISQPRLAGHELGVDLLVHGVDSLTDLVWLRMSNDWAARLVPTNISPNVELAAHAAAPDGQGVIAWVDSSNGGLSLMARLVNANNTLQAPVTLVEEFLNKQTFVRRGSHMEVVRYGNHIVIAVAPVATLRTPMVRVLTYRVSGFNLTQVADITLELGFGSQPRLALLQPRQDQTSMLAYNAASENFAGQGIFVRSIDEQGLLQQEVDDVIPIEAALGPRLTQLEDLQVLGWLINGNPHTPVGQRISDDSALIVPQVTFAPQQFIDPEDYNIASGRVAPYERPRWLASATCGRAINTDPDRLVIRLVNTQGRFLCF